MQLDIVPEPDPQQRAAIEQALHRLLSPTRLPAPYRSGWRQTGIREATGQAADARPRTSFGATRA